MPPRILHYTLDRDPCVPEGLGERLDFRVKDLLQAVVNEEPGVLLLERKKQGFEKGLLGWRQIVGCWREQRMSIAEVRERLRLHEIRDVEHVERWASIGKNIGEVLRGRGDELAVVEEIESNVIVDGWLGKREIQPGLSKKTE